MAILSRGAKKGVLEAIIWIKLHETKEGLTQVPLL